MTPRTRVGRLSRARAAADATATVNKVAALQYMLDMRHTALGTLGLRPPLGRDQLRSKIAW